MRNMTATLCFLAATIHGGAIWADEPCTSLSERIDRLIQEKWKNADFLCHHFTDARVRAMSKRLKTMQFPATNGSVAKTLGISNPKFFVCRRACGISFFPDVNGSTRTHETCRLNKRFELIVVRETEYRADSTTKTIELSAVIRRRDARK